MTVFSYNLYYSFETGYKNDPGIKTFRFVVEQHSKKLRVLQSLTVLLSLWALCFSNFFVHGILQVLKNLTAPLLGKR
jgi:hypothetical protein